MCGGYIIIENGDICCVLRQSLRVFAEFACGLDTLSDIESAISSETADDSDHSLFIILSVVKEPIQTARDICKEWDELFDTIEGSSNTHAYHAPSSQQVGHGFISAEGSLCSSGHLIFLAVLCKITWSELVHCLQTAR